MNTIFRIALLGFLVASLSCHKMETTNLNDAQCEASFKKLTDELINLESCISPIDYKCLAKEISLVTLDVFSVYSHCYLNEQQKSSIEVFFKNLSETISDETLDSQKLMDATLNFTNEVRFDKIVNVY